MLINFSIILNALIINIIFIMYQDKLFNRKYSSTIYVGLCLVLTMCLSVIAIFGMSFLNTIFMSIAMLISSKFLYTQSNRAYILYDLMLIILFVFIDLIVSVIFSIAVQESLSNILSNEWYYFISNILVLIIYFIAYFLFVKSIKVRTVETAELFWEFGSILFELILMVYIISINENNQMGNYVIFSVAVGLIFIYFFQLHEINKLSRYYEMKSMLEVQKNQSDMLYQEYLDIEQTNMRQRKILHDVKNHLRTLDGLLHNDNSAEIIKYKMNLESKLELLVDKYTFNNKTLQVIINNMNYICESNNIELIVHARDVKLEFIDLYDLTTILGNIFDNAIDGCKSVQDKLRRKVEFRLYQVGENLVLYLFNTAKVNIQKEASGQIKSTKEKHYGIGLKNVKSAIEKYGGEIKYDYSDNDFTLTIIIPIPD